MGLPRHGRSVRSATLGLTVLIAALAFSFDFFWVSAPGFGLGQVLLVAGAMLIASCCLLPLAWNERALMVLGSTAMSLLVGELGLRTFFRPDYANIYEMDPLFLHRLIPNSSRYYLRGAINGGGRILVKINGDGFRGDALRRSGRRVVVYGDSCIQGDFSAIENTFVSKLEWELVSRMGAPVESVNAGVDGYGPDQIAVRIEGDLGRLKPNLVVVSLFADNDFGDLVRNKLYRLEGDGTLRANRFVVGDRLRMAFRRAQKAPFVYRLFEKAWVEFDLDPTSPVAREPAAAMERVETWLKLCLAEYEDFVVHDNNEVTNLLSDHYDADIAVAPGSKSARYKVRLMDRVVGRIKEISRERGVRLALLIVPSPIDVCDGYDGGRVDANRHPDYKRTTLTDVLESIAARQGVPAVNLFAAYRRRGANTLYLRGGDNHWNDLGQALAAQLMADRILRERLLN